jgi:hypothetical protein
MSFLVKDSHIVKTEFLGYMSRHFLSPCASLRRCPPPPLKKKLFFRAVICGYFSRVIKINERNCHISVGYLTGSATHIYLQCNNTFENSTTSNVDKALADIAAPPGPVGPGGGPLNIQNTKTLFRFPLSVVVPPMPHIQIYSVTIDASSLTDSVVK